jgi:hypothetical protein
MTSSQFFVVCCMAHLPVWRLLAGPFLFLVQLDPATAAASGSSLSRIRIAD